MPSGLRQQLAILKTLTLYVVRHKPNIAFAMLIGIFSSAIEVAAMTSLIPISLLASGADMPAKSKWLQFPHLLGLQPDVRFFVIAFLLLITLRTFLGSANMAQTYRTYRMLIAHFSSRAQEAWLPRLGASIQRRLGDSWASFTITF